MNPLAQSLSASLLHFIWQGSIVGLLLWITLFALRHRSAHSRYAVSCAALAVLAVLPVITTAVLYSRALSVEGGALSVSASPRALADIPQTFALGWTGVDSQTTAGLTSLQAWALPIWSVGVLLFSLRLLFGGAHTFALRRHGQPADDGVPAMVVRLAARMSLQRQVRVLTSYGVDAPSVIGWLRPVILLPPASLLGLTPQQLEAVLAHELAHVRRHDYLVNILQMVAETLFFHHPAVWWTSRQIRRERELCCDDLAVHACGDALCYARALTTLEKLRVAAPRLAMSSTGGPLYRIQRLLGPEAREYEPSRWPGVVALGLSLACVALNVSWLRAQTQPAARSAFEVASVKPNTSGGGLVSIGYPGGRFTATNATLRMLLRNAYGLLDFQIEGGPSWISSARFDILAKADGVATVPQMQAMLRTLLADRFKLTTHAETSDLPVYALVVARSDGRLGPQLKRSGAECLPITALPGAPPPPPPPPGPAPTRDATQCPSMLGMGNMSGRKLPMTRLAIALSQSVNRIVLDRTGLAGDFDLDLQWTPDLPQGGRAPGQPAVFNGQIIDPNGPSLFTALQEQLGLKLDSQRGPVERLVIDRVEQPTED